MVVMEDHKKKSLAEAKSILINGWFYEDHKPNHTHKA